MRSRLARVLTVLALSVSALIGIVHARPAMADAAPQTSLTITKYAADGTTVENQTTVTYQWLEDNLTVQGDGTTHYWTQGPTFDPANPWDPAETLNLKNKGALKGTDLKDLCDLVGGAAHGDTVQVKAADGYNDVFDAENIYSPVSRQGPIVICWWKDGLYTGAWTDGMLLAFFADNSTNPYGLHVFGHQDMHDCLPQSNWHWYYDGAIQYPSTDGMYLKWVSQVNIYSGGTAGWSFAVSGNRADSIPQNWFENGVACGHLGATYTDSSGNIWSGMPLMYPCGIVDDTTNIHGAGAFNDALAAAGYDVKVIGSNGDNYTCRSTVVANNQSLILANTVKLANTDNYTPLTGNQYPLKLVGPGLTPDEMVEGVSEIQLLNFPPFIQASAGVGGSISPSGDMVLISGFDQPFTITALPGYHILDVKVDGSSIGAVDNYTFTNVTSYHTIAASFAVNTCTITATAGAGGAISPLGTVTVTYGGNQTFTITANPFYRIYDVKVDGGSVGVGSSYLFSNVTIDHTIAATFAPVWDLNNDHLCNITDVVKIGLCWGQTGAHGWIPEDLNNDGTIDITDVVVVGIFWNQGW